MTELNQVALQRDSFRCPPLPASEENQFSAIYRRQATPLTFSWAVLRGYIVRHYQARRLLVFPSTASQFPSIGWGSICIENRRTAKLWQSYGRPSISRATTGGIPYLRNAKVERVNYGYTALPTESQKSPSISRAGHAETDKIRLFVIHNTHPLMS